MAIFHLTLICLNLRRCEVVSDVWSENTALFERLMEIHYDGFNGVKDVPLRTRRALLLYKVYGNSSLLLFNRTSFNSDSLLMALSR